jgi:glycine cleavage system H protein
MNRPSNIAKQIHLALDVLTTNILRIPQGLFYNKNHTWSFLEKSGNARIGIDDFLLKIVGNVKVNYLKFPGEKLSKGEVLAEINQNGKRLRITSPISGEIVTTNNSITENPEKLQEDPYGKGWICAIKPSNWKTETQYYYLGAEASKWITNELVRFKDFLSVSLVKNSSEQSVIVFQEGGELRQNILSELDEKIWMDFQESFLNK